MEQETKGIVFKGNSEGLVIVIPEEYDFVRAINEIEDKIKSSARFFKGARIKVAYRGINLTTQQEDEIKRILDKKSGAIIESFSKDDESKLKSLVANSQPKTIIPTRKTFFSNGEEGTCKFVRSTIRSGTRIEYDGSVVILGDVNPGGEIVASGNVVVLGTLRGMVHAGAQGDREAFIYALNLKPTQIRIAEAIARMPEGEEEDSMQPELAKIKDDIIEVVQL
ncbi:MAG: septum site-determining protein MinC [Acetivibrionales bacterium]|jgi:septum site-determining protein MinC|nr:septum site-determining protein MinC [Clostridiaceae bacterium]